MTYQKSIVTILLVITGALIIVVSLYAISERLNSTPNGFNRKLNPSFTTLLYTVETGSDVYHIVGTSSHHIYLSSLLHGIFLDINTEHKKVTRDTLAGFHFPWYHVAFQMTIDSPAITIAVGNFKKIYFGNVDSKRIVDSINTPYVFLRSCLLADKTFALCSFDTGKIPTLFFEKFKAANGPWERGSSIFSKNESDMIASDGLLQYDTANKKLIYCSFYESHFIAMDTNLHQQSEIHTIDTFHTNFTKGGLASSAQKSLVRYTNTSPRYTINANFNVFEGLVYIQSRLKADNDSKTDFEHNSVIDVYDTQKKIYLYSFYLPHGEKEQVLDFKVVKGRLLVLYPSHLKVFGIKN